MLTPLLELWLFIPEHVDPPAMFLFDFGLFPKEITELATGTYLEKGESVLITGAIGRGKSFLASALGHQACSQGNKVLYYNTQKLLMQTNARIDGLKSKIFESKAYQ